MDSTLWGTACVLTSSTAGSCAEENEGRAVAEAMEEAGSGMLQPQAINQSHPWGAVVL